MRIALMAGQVDRRVGSHFYHQIIAQGLATKGHEVSLVCFSADEQTARLCQVYPVSTRQWTSKPIIWPYSAWLRASELKRAFRKLDLPHPEVAFIGEHLWIPGFLRRFPKVPWIYFPHSLVVDREIKGYGLPPRMERATLRLYRRLQRMALNHADVTLRFTQAGCRELAQAYRTKARFHVIAPGVERPDEIHQPRADRENTSILSVGSLTSGKGFDLAIRALAELKHLPWFYQVAGEGDMRSFLEGLAAENGIADRVRFLGHSENVSALYREADLLLFPSRSESLGFVLLESMAHGVPALAFRADGAEFLNVNEELIDPGRTGYLARDFIDFRNQLHELLRDRSSLKTVGESARQEAIDRYSWVQHNARLEELLGELRNQPSSRAIDFSNQD